MERVPIYYVIFISKSLIETKKNLLNSFTSLCNKQSRPVSSLYFSKKV